MMQYAYSPHLESDTVCEVLKGDVIGMRLTPDRRGIQIVKEEEDTTEDATLLGALGVTTAAAAAAHDPAGASATGTEAAKGGEEAGGAGSSEAGTLPTGPAPASSCKRMRLRVLKTIPEVISFPLKVMVVFQPSPSPQP